VFSRPIDCQRVNAEDDPDAFIDWFRRFNNIKRKWGIIDSDIYNMDESGTGLGAEQKSKVILPREEKKHFTKKASNHE
jgi:hypothetical protein